jgi:hypothetical protein
LDLDAWLNALRSYARTQENYNKNNNIFNKNKNIFYINTLNYKNNNYIYNINKDQRKLNLDKKNNPKDLNPDREPKQNRSYVQNPKSLHLKDRKLHKALIVGDR